MGDRGFEAVFRPRVRQYYEQLSANDRAEIDRIREALEADPDPDGDTKNVIEIPPDIKVTAYTDGRWWVLYLIWEPGHIVVDYITPADPSPWFAR